MLHVGKCYRDNDNREVVIGGRINGYSPQQPYVWSTRGDWYHEHTGAFLNSTRTRSLYPLPIDHRLSISKHDDENGETEQPETRAVRLLRDIVRYRDLTALETFCLNFRYARVIDIATRAGIDLGELEELLHEIS